MLLAELDPTSDQQQEHEHRKRVKIDFAAIGNRIEETDDRSDSQPQRDR